MVDFADRGSRAVRRGSKVSARVHAVEGGRVTTRRDSLATEEPLAIRITGGGSTRDLTITMRTPGADFELAAGFLFSEGLVRDRREIEQLSYCVDASATGAAQDYNIVTIEFRDPSPAFDDLASRPFAMSSACGICGQANLDALADKGWAALPPGFAVTSDMLRSLPDKVRARQRLFDATGGIHAAALCTADGAVLAVREDVGRHNAVDKVIGWAFLEGRLPLRDLVLFASGRAGFEITQKCIAAGIPILAAVSAPSSLAVDAATEFRLTLVGFLRGERFNVYSGIERINVGAPTPER